MFYFDHVALVNNAMQLKVLLAITNWVQALKEMHKFGSKIQSMEATKIQAFPPIVNELMIECKINTKVILKKVICALFLFLIEGY